jgi:hypothetical protein
MRLHTAAQCEVVANAIKKQTDYLLFAIEKEDGLECQYHLEQIDQLLAKLKFEKNGDN